MDSRFGRILAGFEARLDDLAEEIAEASVTEVEGFGPIRDVRLRTEIRTLARQHLDAFLETARTGGPPAEHALAAARARAMTRARELVPLAALLHSYLIAQRVISAAITREAGPGAASRGAALELMARTFDYNIAVTTAMADAYVEVVQGDLADLESARGELVEALLANGSDAWPELTRRATGLGLDPRHSYVVALVTIEPAPASLRSAAQTLARATGRPERGVFVVGRDRELLAVLDATGRHTATGVLARASNTLRQTHNAELRAGIGTVFVGLAGFSASHQHAQRALRHASQQNPIVRGPDDIRIFNELTIAAGAAAAHLIPHPTQTALADPALRASIAAFFDANLNVAAAAQALSLHPNSLRYRLNRIATLTGRDPHKLTDLLELVMAMRLTN